MLKEDVRKLQERVDKLEERSTKLTNKLIAFGWALDVLGQKGVLKPGEVDAYGRERIRNSLKNKEDAGK